MSTHDAHGAAGPATHDHDFDGEPVAALAPDEPRTPGWLPALGAALFVVAAVWFLAISKGDDAAAAAAAASASADAAPASAAAPAPPAAPTPSGAARGDRAAQLIRDQARAVQALPTVHAGAPGAPPPPPASAIHKFTPEELARMRKAIQEQQGK